MRPISDTTKAVLLLTAPLLQSSGTSKDPILSDGEYQRLAKALHLADRRPEDLLGRDSVSILRDLASSFDYERVRILLNRGLLLAERLESWSSAGIFVSSRADQSYPSILLDSLGPKSPPLLYHYMDGLVYPTPALAVVGSRNASQAALNSAAAIGKLAAECEISIVSGAARGIDRTAMLAGLNGGGVAVGVVAHGLVTSVLDSDFRSFLQSRQLVLVSPGDPNSSFNVGRAMARNKVIYACAQAGLVVTASENKGGTWSGAVEYLRRPKSRLYVDSDNLAPQVTSKLIDKGARVWKHPDTRDAFVRLLEDSPGTSVSKSTGQLSLFEENPVESASTIQES